jgi:hypothetical protein
VYKAGQIKKAKRRGRKGNFPWEGQHSISKVRLHLAERADRDPLLVLFENGKQILGQKIAACAVDHFTRLQCRHHFAYVANP